MEENRNEARLAEWKRRMAPVIVVATILPVAVAFTDRRNHQPAVWLDIASWLVFVADYSRFGMMPAHVRESLTGTPLPAHC